MAVGVNPAGRCVEIKRDTAEVRSKKSKVQDDKVNFCRTAKLQGALRWETLFQTQKVLNMQLMTGCGQK